VDWHSITGLPDLSNPHFLERALHWSALSWVVLVALAAAAGCLVAFFSSRTTFIKNIEMMALQLTTGESVAAAHTQAAQARAQTAKSLETQKRLEAEAARAHVHREQLHRKNLELQVELEKERAARLRLEEQLAPRHVASAQRQVMAAALSAFKGQSLAMTIPPGDPEIVNFAGEIQAALEQAGIQVSLAPALTYPAPQPGITFDVGVNRRELATALAHAFVDAGICTGPISASEAGNPDVLEIILGPRR
jgi:hypothetical protein